MNQSQCTTVRTIISRQHKTPIMVFKNPNDKSLSSSVYNEENIFVGFGVHNSKTLKTSFGIYRINDGKPHLSKHYHFGGPNGIRVNVPNHAASVNWLQGVTERALTNKMPEGSYFLPLKTAQKLDKEKLKLPLNLRSCLELADMLQTAASSIPFDIWAIDEVGAPNPVEEFQMDQDRLRRLITNRFLESLWGNNPSLAQAWKNAIVRGQQLKLCYEQEASIQLEAIKDGLRNQVIEHARTNWCDGNGKLKFPWFSNLGAKLNRIIDFYTDLVSQGPVTLQKCAGVHNVDTPLVVGVVGSPVVVGKVELPDDWLFPVTWKTSPFETLEEGETDKAKESANS